MLVHHVHLYIYFSFLSLRMLFQISWGIAVFEFKSVFIFSSVKLFYYFSWVKKNVSFAFTNKSITQMLNWADWWLDEKKWWKEWCQHKQNIAIHFYPNESTTGHERGSNTNSSDKQPRAPTLHRAPCLHADSFFLVPLVKLHQPLSLSFVGTIA